MSKEPLSIWKNTKVQIHEIINTYCIESLNSPFRDSSIDWSAYIDPSFVLPCIASVHVRGAMLWTGPLLVPSPLL